MNLLDESSQDESSESKKKFAQARNCCKKVLEASKLAYANKTRVHQFSETLLSGLFLKC